MKSFGSKNGSENGKQSDRDKERKGIFIGIGGAVFIFFLIAKMIVSYFPLESSPLKFPASSAVLAEERAQPEAKKGISHSPITFSSKMTKKKERELKKKEMLLKKGEEELISLKKEIDEKFWEFDELQARLTAFAKSLADRENRLKNTKMGHVATIFTAMPPTRATAIMDKMKIQTVVRILHHMKGKSACKIMTMMRPEQGAFISEKLIQLGQLSSS